MALSSSSLPSISAKGGCEEKLTRVKTEYAYDIWSPFFRFQIQLRCPLGSVLSGLHSATLVDDFVDLRQMLQHELHDY